MSAVAAGDPPPYRPSYGVLACSGGHGRVGGDLDETQRRLSHSEYKAATLLAGEGHQVRALAETPGRGSRPDLTVCGLEVEVKSFRTVAEGGRGRPSAWAVYNKLAEASKQADHAFIIGDGTGLTEQAARKGIARYSKSPPHDLPVLKNIRVKGDGFDLSFTRAPARGVENTTPKPPPGPQLGL